MSEPGASIQTSKRAEILRGGPLVGRSLPAQVLLLALWPLLEQVLAFLVGLTDLLIAGRTATGGEQVAILDAMGLGSYVGWVFNILQAAVATGVMALVSRATGGGDPALAQRGLGQGLWLGTAAGIVSTLMLLGGAGLLIRWMGLDGAAAHKAAEYLRVLAWSGPFSGALLAVNAALRGFGDTRTPFVSMLVVNAVNMACSWAFAFAPAPIGGHGIAGIAAGTVIGWAAGLAVVLSMLSRSRSGRLGLSRAAVIPHPATAGRILRVGSPQALEIAGMWMIHASSIRVINGLGQEGALGSHILAIRVESMSFLPGFAIGTAAAALAGQYLGAGSKEMAVKAVRLCWKAAVLLMSALGLLFALFRTEMISLMAPGSGLHAQLAAPLLVVCALTQPFFATCIVFKTSMRGAGATTTVMIWAFASMFFYRVLVLTMLARGGYASLTVVWVVLSLDLVTQAAVFSFLHFRGRWLDARV